MDIEREKVDAILEQLAGHVIHQNGKYISCFTDLPNHYFVMNFMMIMVAMTMTVLVIVTMVHREENGNGDRNDNDNGDDDDEYNEY